MAIFLSAGHHLKDSGAVYNGRQENLEAIRLRDIMVNLCRSRGLKVITDDDNETLPQYLNRIKTGSGSVVLEIHFDAVADNKATGTTCLVGNDADRLDKGFAKEIVDKTADVLGIKNRGVKTEAESHRGKLGLMREQGIVALWEVCFISNPNDMAAYDANMHKLAGEIVPILEKYENIIV